MSALIRLASRLYPRWWRERYGEELAALIEDARPGFGGALDIAKGALAMQISTPFRVKRIWLMGALLGLVIGWTASYWMPSNFQSSAVLQLQDMPNATTQDILDVVSKNANITMSRSSLSALIRNFNLYPVERNRMPLEDVLKTMRKNVTLSPISVGAQGIALPAFQISFAYPDRFVANRIVQELTNRLTASSGLVILDAPSLPVVPLSPNRGPLTFVGFVAGLVMGGIVALLIYIRRLQKKVKELAG